MSAPSTSGLSVELLLRVTDVKYGCFTLLYFKAVCRNGGFNLTKFEGNTERIINSIPDEHRAENVKSLTLGQDKLPIERSLVVIWCIESDTFNFRIELKDKHSFDD